MPEIFDEIKSGSFALLVHRKRRMKYAELITIIATANEHFVGRATSFINQALVRRNWLIGAYLVEFQQRGEDRAKYGAGCSNAWRGICKNAV